jgi:hypothetical protein
MKGHDVTCPFILNQPAKKDNATQRLLWFRYIDILDHPGHLAPVRVKNERPAVNYLNDLSAQFGLSNAGQREHEDSQHE